MFPPGVVESYQDFCVTCMYSTVPLGHQGHYKKCITKPCIEGKYYFEEKSGENSSATTEETKRTIDIQCTFKCPYFDTLFSENSVLL
jgi:hypothetical protein